METISSAELSTAVYRHSDQTSSSFFMVVYNRRTHCAARKFVSQQEILGCALGGRQIYAHIYSFISIISAFLCQGTTRYIEISPGRRRAACGLDSDHLYIFGTARHLDKVMRKPIKIINEHCGEIVVERKI